MDSISVACLTTLTALTILSCATVHAQPLPESMVTCAAESDDARRLACYDREVSALTRNDAQPPASGAVVPVAPEKDFGYRGKVAREELDRKAAQEALVERLEGTITELSKRPHGQLVITLDNGQVWEQKTTDSKIRLKTGDQITIKKASLGSFMLVAPSGRTTRVSRVQ